MRELVSCVARPVDLQYIMSSARSSLVSTDGLIAERGSNENFDFQLRASQFPTKSMGLSTTSYARSVLGGLAGWMKCLDGAFQIQSRIFGRLKNWEIEEVKPAAPIAANTRTDSNVQTLESKRNILLTPEWSAIRYNPQLWTNKFCNLFFFWANIRCENSICLNTRQCIALVWHHDNV